MKSKRDISKLNLIHRNGSYGSIVSTTILTLSNRRRNIVCFVGFSAVIAAQMHHTNQKIIIIAMTNESVSGQVYTEGPIKDSLSLIYR